ncbi:MAG: threonine synthase [Elusimicrobiota bacterium]
MKNYYGIIDKYKDFLDVSYNTPIVTLYEGNTPLLRAKNIERLLSFENELYLKYEGLNPTGSFKDRGMTFAISKAKESGAKAVMCASTGNTSASASAYAAQAGMECIVVIPEGNIALGKLSQALMHKAKVIAIRGNFDAALTMVKKVTEKYPVVLVNSLNPFRIEGQKTGAFEIVDVLGTAPDFHFIPVGNAGNITAYWKGYREYINHGKILPKMMGFQAAGAAPIVLGKIVENPETVATAIRIGNPASWKSAESARDESKGVIDMVNDEEILDAYKLLASQEGVFCEPASAASLAGLIKYLQKGYFKDIKKKKIVCVLTGHGLKDPDNAVKVSSKPITIENDFNILVKTIGL